MNISTAKAIVLNNLKISEGSFYYYFNKLRFPRRSLSDLLKSYDKMNYYISIAPYELDSNRLPDLLIIITPLMKKNYQRYGQFTSFDLTFNLIKDPHP